MLLREGGGLHGEQERVLCCTGTNGGCVLTRRAADITPKYHDMPLHHHAPPAQAQAGVLPGVVSHDGCIRPPRLLCPPYLPSSRPPATGGTLFGTTLGV